MELKMPKDNTSNDEFTKGGLPKIDFSLLPMHNYKFKKEITDKEHKWTLSYERLDSEWFNHTWNLTMQKIEAENEQINIRHNCLYHLSKFFPMIIPYIIEEYLKESIMEKVNTHNENLLIKTKKSKRTKNEK